MDRATLNATADALEKLANQHGWNPEAWQQCYDFVTANWDNELLRYVHDDLIHYDGEFHSRNILGFHVRPNSRRLDNYRHEFRAIAAALRADLSLVEAKKQFGL